MEENEKKALKTLEETRQAWARIVNRYIKKLQKENEELKEKYSRKLIDFQKEREEYEKELEQEKEKNKMLKDLTKQAQEDVKIWKDLYDKVKKENEELTEALEEWVNGKRINTLFCVSKDKIKDKIRELKKDMVQNGKAIDILYDILEGE